MGDFSKKEQEILFELNINARTAINKIAKRLKMSQQGLAYRIKKLEEQKVIEQYITLFDYASFGYQGYKVLLMLNRLKTEQIECFRKALQTHSAVLSIEELSGHWDYMVVFATKNASHCNKELHDLLAQFPKLIKNYIVLTNVVSYNFQRRYLTNSSAHSGVTIFGGDRTFAKLERIEKKLVKDLYEDPVIMYSHLAAKHKINPKTIISKIKKLETKGIIKGYSAVIDCYKYNYFPQKIFLKLDNLSIEKEEECMNFCRQQKNILRVSKLFGQWDMEIELEMKDTRELQDFCTHLRTNVGDIIRNVETCSVIKQHKIANLPLSFFLEK